MKTEWPKVNTATLADAHSEVILSVEKLWDQAVRLKSDNKKMREFIEEVKLAPYKDSNLESLCETLRIRAENVIVSLKT